MEKAIAGEIVEDEDRRVVPVVAVHQVPVRVTVKVEREEVEVTDREDENTGSTESIDLREMSMGVAMWSQGGRRVGAEVGTNTS